VDRNLAFGQQSLKVEMAHPGETARLAKRQPFLLEQSQRELSPDFRLTHAGCGQDFVWNGYWHPLYYTAFTHGSDRNVAGAERLDASVRSVHQKLWSQSQTPGRFQEG